MSTLDGLGLFLMSAITLRNWHSWKNSTPTRFQSPRGPGTCVDYWLAKDSENDFLKEVLGDKAISWVKEQNQESIDVLGNPEGTELYTRIRNILDSKEKIPDVTKIGKLFYNFWKDDKNPRGLLRRTTFEDYFKAEVNWELVLDIDELGKTENQSWVYHGHVPNNCLDANEDRVLVRLSPGGSDADVIREFDLKSKSFVEEKDGGFVVPVAKSRVSWKSNDELLIGTDWKDDNSLTDSGYPRLVKVWKRGTPLTDAVLLFEGLKTDVSISGYVSRHKTHVVTWLNRGLEFYKSEKLFAYQSLEEDHEKPINKKHKKKKSPSQQQVTHGKDHFVTLNVPIDAEVSHFCDQFLIFLRSDWLLNDISYEKGSLLSIPIEEFLHLHSMSGATSVHHTVTRLFTPSPTTSLDTWTSTKDYLVINVLNDVKTQVVFWRYSEENNEENEKAVEGETARTGGKWILEDEETGEFIHSFLLFCRSFSCTLFAFFSYLLF
jgi:prolyl oligopeptidase